MKNLLCVSIFILALSLSAFSQTTENSNCPTISILGPAGIVAPNNPATYVVKIERKGKELKLEYIWSVNAGEILEGQGTESLVVKQPDAILIVTVEIKGLPEGCESFSSETSCYLRPSEAEMIIDEFSIASTRIDKARIDYFLTELQNNPNDQGYIIEKFKKNTPKAAIKNKLKKLSDYLVKIRRFDPTRITIVHDLADENRTQFWRVPPGAETPTIE